MRVGIVGLGIAGLRAAALLEAAGAEVSLFEARDRVGGRLHTVDKGYGVVYEAGGEWIDADHHRVLALLHEFNLGPDPRVGWPKRLCWRGKQTREDLMWNDALEDDLRVEAAAREMCRDLRQPPWENTAFEDLDNRRLGDFLREHTQSERGLWWVMAKYRSDEGEDPDRVGLLGWLVGFMHYLGREGEEMSAFRIPGGAGALCQQMALALGAEPNLNSPLRRVRQGPDGVELIFEHGKEKVDAVILTLPPPALERVVFEPALSTAKRCAIEASEMGRVVKICWQFREAWWRGDEWSGSMQCDGPIQQTWDGSMGTAPILSAYVCGDDSVIWQNERNPVLAGLREVTRYWPEAQELYVRGWMHDWTRDPYAMGGFAHLAPGYVLEHMKHIAPPDGRIHFAGEHTASWVGFIEGALESAERVVGEIVN